MKTRWPVKFSGTFLTFHEGWIVRESTRALTLAHSDFFQGAGPE